MTGPSGRGASRLGRTALSHCGHTAVLTCASALTGNESLRLRALVALLLARQEPQSLGQRRYQRIIQATVTAVLGKGINVLVLLISVPLTLGYLGGERYGIWIAMTTVTRSGRL